MADDHVESTDSALESSSMRTASAPVEGIHASAAVVPAPDEAFPMAVAWEDEDVSPGCEATLVHTCSPITVGGVMANDSA